MHRLHPGLSKLPARVGGPGSDITEVFRQCGEKFSQFSVYVIAFFSVMLLPGPPTRAGIFRTRGG